MLYNDAMTLLQIYIRRIQKRLTAIDYILLFLFVITIGGFVIFFRREVKFVTLKLKVTDVTPVYLANQPPEEIIYAFKKGDTERNELGQIVSEITDVATYRVSPEKLSIYITVKTKAVYNPRKQQYTLKGKPVLLRESFMFHFTNVRFEGTIVDLPELREPSTKGVTIVEARLGINPTEFADRHGVPDYVASAVKVGNTVVDSQGQTLAEITQVQIVPAKRTVSTATGTPLVVNDPQLKDVFLTVKLTTHTYNGKTYMFEYLPVDVNVILPLNLPAITIMPVITRVAKWPTAE